MIKTKGFQKLLKKLDRMKRKEARPAMRAAVRAGSAVLKAAAKAAAPVDEGLLKKAIDDKITNRGDRFAAIIGANVAKLQAYEEKGERPSNIDHLVEFGHEGINGSFVPANGYMRRSSAQAMPSAEARTEQVLREKIEKAAVQ